MTPDEWTLKLWIRAPHASLDLLGFLGCLLSRDPLAGDLLTYGDDLEGVARDIADRGCVDVAVDLMVLASILRQEAARCGPARVWPPQV